MSKAGDFVKKIEEEIESIFAGGHTETAESAADHPSRSGYTVEEDELAVPEIHTGKAAHKGTDQTGAQPAGKTEESTDESGSPEEKEKKPTIRYDTVAVPEIHIPHKK